MFFNVLSLKRQPTKAAWKKSLPKFTNIYRKICTWTHSSKSARLLTMISFNEVYQESSLRCNNAFREFPTTYVVSVKYKGGGTESFSVFLKEFCSPGIIELRFSGPINFFEKDFKVPTINFSFLYKVCICTNKKVFRVTG